MYKKRLLFLTMACAFVATISILAYLYISNTPFYRDDHGNTHGSGVEQFSYPDGAPKIITTYRFGHPISSTWYRPDGSIVFTTEWVDGEGMWYWLRDDGSLRAQCNMKDGFAHGKMISYNPDGTIQRTVVMEEGVEVD